MSLQEIGRRVARCARWVQVASCSEGDTGRAYGITSPGGLGATSPQDTVYE